MIPRKSTIFLVGVIMAGFALSAALLHGAHAARSSTAAAGRKAQLVRQLDLTDLCLFTEASYTRNPGMTDLATPFQDAPASLEHFPTGALLQPPGHLLRNTRD